jgi:hypothetical protein
MPTPTWTRLVIGLAAALWGLLAYLLKAPINATWLKPAGYVMSAVVLLLLMFDRWAWRWLPLGVVRRPNIRGTWKAALHYEWPEGNRQTKDCYLVIRQTFSTVSVQMYFDISASESRSADIVEQNGRRSLWWSYWSAARPFDRENNPPHRGGAELSISTVPKVSLTGSYWTERKTRGEITTSGRSKKLYEDFAGAEQAEFV